MIGGGVYDHSNIAELLRTEHFVSQAFRIALLEPIPFPAIPQVVGVFVATQAATADVAGVRVDDYIIAHGFAPIGRRTSYPIVSLIRVIFRKLSADIQRVFKHSLHFMIGTSYNLAYYFFLKRRFAMKKRMGLFGL
jgi:hypothetical protein